MCYFVKLLEVFDVVGRRADRGLLANGYTVNVRKTDAPPGSTNVGSMDVLVRDLVGQRRTSTNVGVIQQELRGLFNLR